MLACPDRPSLYEVPLCLHEQGFDALVLERLSLAPRAADLAPLRAFLDAQGRCEGAVRRRRGGAST